MPVPPAPSPTPRPDPPPSWLSVALSVCFCLILTFFLCRGVSSVPSRAAAPTPTPDLPTTAPTPTPTPTPAPYDYTQPVPQGEAVDQESWFADAVFVGDSRVDGFRLFSGVTPKAAFLNYNGLSVYDVMEGKPVIRAGEQKISILEALEQQQYGKVYLSLGINELGYYDAPGFAQTYGGIVDAVRESQPGAAIYVQAIIPVNSAKCEANDVFYYITNEGVADYNAALAQMCADKQVMLVGVPDGLLDQNGETAEEYSADGVHFKREGYAVWLDYLTTHTGS